MEILFLLRTNIKNNRFGLEKISIIKPTSVKNKNIRKKCSIKKNKFKVNKCRTNKLFSNFWIPVHVMFYFDSFYDINKNKQQET